MYLEIVNAIDRPTEKLQGALDLMLNSVTKCIVLIIGHVPFDVKYLVHDTVLPCVSASRDLGIVIAQDLSPSTHISEITAKAHQRANCILRCFVSKDINLLLRAYIVYELPIVEFCSIVWSSSLKKDIELIEKVSVVLQRDCQDSNTSHTMKDCAMLV